MKPAGLRHYLTFLFLLPWWREKAAGGAGRQQRTCFDPLSLSLSLHLGLTQTETLLAVFQQNIIISATALPRPEAAWPPRKTRSAVRAMLMILLTSIKFGFPTAKIFVKCRSISKIVDSSRGREMSICPFELENRFNT